MESASPGAYQTTPVEVGIQMVFYPCSILRAKTMGTYYGGSLDDRLNACSLNNIGNIYAAGQTSSSDNIASPGAYQTIFGGINDGFLVNSISAARRQWGYLFWRRQFRFGDRMSVNDSCYVYISGYTRSRNNIATPRVISARIWSGTEDAFLAKFDSTGNLKWSTYYVEVREMKVKMCCRYNGHIYLAGSTSSANNMATPGACQTDYGEVPGMPSL